MSKSCCSNKKNDGTESSGLFEPVNFTQEVGFSDGSFTSPSITFVNDTNTGFLRVGGGDIGVTCNGTSTMRISPVAITAQNILRVEDGTAISPGLQFSSDTDTGLRLVGVGDMALVVGGSNRMRIDTSVIQPLVPIRGSDGSAVLPAYSFNSDGDTGVFLNGTNNIGISTGGVARLTMGGIDVVLTLPIRVPDGSSSSPSFSFSGDTDSGMFRIGSGDIGITCNATQSINFTSTGFSSTVQPHFAVRGSAAQSIPNNSFTTYTSWGTPSNNVGYTSFTSGVLTLAEDGVYQVSCAVFFAANATGRRAVRVQASTGDNLGYEEIGNLGSNVTVLNVSGVKRLTTGNTLQVQVYQNSGANLNVGSGDARTYLQVVKLY